MKTRKKLMYVAPTIDVRRVYLEVSVAATMSIGPVSAQVEGWDEGSSPITLGDDPATEGGDVYMPW